jgi:AraC family transcriptional regulator
MLPPPRAVDGSDALCILVGSGRSCVLESAHAIAGIWIPLRGRLQLGGDDVIACGELLATEAEPSLRVIGRGNALWVALVGARAAWHGALDGLSDIPLPEPQLLPARHAADLPLRRRALTLARAAGSDKADAVAAGLIEDVLMLQKAFAAAIARCRGRTYAQRRQVFLRLQRVRNHIIANCQHELDNEELARIASYSPWQFIRAFRTAYAQTPHAFVIEQRLRLARRLLSTSPLSISEVAAASGFEDRCAFSRLFSERFGMTARAFRRVAVDARLAA